jgi:RNA polymerase sigma factor (TIGR02999 family)
MTETREVTRLLAAWRDGDATARDALVAKVYPELHRLAEAYMRREGSGHTLQATALIHEAFVRLVEGDVAYADRTHFFAVAARVMRRVLVDHAKTRSRQKRGGGQARITFEEELLVRDGPSDELLALDEALTRLHAMDARKAEAIELHYFGGLKHHEVARVLGISPATVDRDLRLAKAWLYTELSEP